MQADTLKTITGTFSPILKHYDFPWKLLCLSKSCKYLISGGCATFLVRLSFFVNYDFSYGQNDCGYLFSTKSSASAYFCILKKKTQHKKKEALLNIGESMNSIFWYPATAVFFTLRLCNRPGLHAHVYCTYVVIRYHHGFM